MARAAVGRLALMVLAGAGLAGCEMQAPGAGTGDRAALASLAAPARGVEERDVETPEVFQAADMALWDGRPSLGGVWVASPDAVDPERVIMRNPANGKSVVGALFRRERDNPGPRLQISSDAAEALGILAGAPTEISVVALRREEAPAEVAPPPVEAVAAEDGKAADEPVAGAAIESTALGDIAATAIDKAEGKVTDKQPAEDKGADALAPEAEPAATAADAAPAKEAAPAAPATGGALIQIGIFSVEANAQRAVEMLAVVGIAATITPGKSQGKAFWSVTARGDAEALAKIKAAGFGDAYVLK